MLKKKVAFNLTGAIPRDTRDKGRRGAEKTASQTNGGNNSQQNATSKRNAQRRKLKRRQMRQVRTDLLALFASEPEGLWATDIMSRYKAKYNRELNFLYFGCTSIISLMESLQDTLIITRPTELGDWLIIDQRYATAACSDHDAPSTDVTPHDTATPHNTATPHDTLHPEVPLLANASFPPDVTPPADASSPSEVKPRADMPESDDSDDALPGISYDPEVFPEDCLGKNETIASLSLKELVPGAVMGVIVGEVYSPSHFWFIRLGEKYSNAMEDLFGLMSDYYDGEGRTRVLSQAARKRVGHYCAVLFKGDWHRAVIVRVLDIDTAKIRHVDYGTVDTVSSSELRPLRRCFSLLPAQACRARLGSVRPSCDAQHWLRPTATYFLSLVYHRQLVGSVTGLNSKENVVEMLLATSSTEELDIGEELIRSGHAVRRSSCSLWAKDSYLNPSFEALESAATPNFGEIWKYLRDGISLESVEYYRRHVLLPSQSSVNNNEVNGKGSEATVSTTGLDQGLDLSTSDQTPARTSPPLQTPASVAIDFDVGNLAALAARNKTASATHRRTLSE